MGMRSLVRAARWCILACVYGVLLTGGASGPRTMEAITDVTRQPAMFGESEAYERFMGRWSRQLAPLFVRFAGVRVGDSVLDLGSGTGALAGAVIRLNPGARVTGVDPSSE